MAKQVEFTKEGKDDLEEIFFSIDKYSASYAISWSNQLFEKVELLENFPEMGRVVLEIRIESIREIIFKDYRIIYEIRNDKIYILAIRHSKRPLSEY